MSKYLIPFNKGSMMEYTGGKPPALAGVVVPPPVNSWYPDEWRDNYTFEAALKMTGQSRGRSAARFSVKNLKNGEAYSMGMSSFYDAVVTFGVKPGGIIEGKWTFRKQGSNFSLMPVKDTPDVPDDRC